MVPAAPRSPPPARGGGGQADDSDSGSVAGTGPRRRACGLLGPRPRLDRTSGTGPAQAPAGASAFGRGG